MKRLLIVTALVAAAIAFWLFNGTPDRAVDAPKATATSATPPSLAQTPSVAPSVPSGDPLDRTAAQDTARAVLTAWARPDQPYDQWWTDLQPLLTDDAQESFSFTDPTTIPALTITGAASESENSGDPYVATFYFPTDAGTFGVDVARDPNGGPWKAFSIIFPGGESQRQ